MLELEHDSYQRKELQTGREVESESMKSDLSDCQTPFYSSTRGGQRGECSLQDLLSNTFIIYSVILDVRKYLIG